MKSLTGAGCLACFALYLAWSSSIFATPPVPRHEPEVAQAKEQGSKAEEGSVAEKRLRNRQIVERGMKLYRSARCGSCHGPKGIGGVVNPNYIDDHYPRLDNMAEKLSLRFPEDVGAVVHRLSAGKSLNDPMKIDVWKSGVVGAKYRFVVNTIAEGSEAGKKDMEGPEPKNMPAYKDSLTESEINQLIAALLILNPLEREEEENE